MESDAQQTLLQITVGGQPRGIDDTIDATVDHDGHIARDRRGHADVLLDHEHGDVAIFAQLHEHLFDLGDNDRRKALRRLIHDEKMRIGQQGARDRKH